MSERPVKEIDTAKKALGWENDNNAYRRWRRKVQAECVSRRIYCKSTCSEAQWLAFTEFAINDPDFRMKTACTSSDSRGDALRKHLDAILMDIPKKVNPDVRHGNRAVETLQRIYNREAAELSDADDEGPGRSRGKRQKPVIGIPVSFEIMDPASPAVHKVPNSEYYTFGSSAVTRKDWGILYEPTIMDLYGLVKVKYPTQNFRSLRVYTGSGVPNHDVSAGISSRSIESTEELQFALKICQKDPLHLVAYVDNEPTRPNSPPPAGEEWLDFRQFIPRVEYEDPATDSEEEKRLRSGMGKAKMPKSDLQFEKRLSQIRARIRRQKELKKLVKDAHKAKCPDAIHSDDDRLWRVLRHIPGAGGPQGRIDKRQEAKDNEAALGPDDDPGSAGSEAHADA